MASLVEFQDLTQTYQTAQTGLLQDPECCDVHALDEIMGFEPLPTPPLSPEPVASGPPSKAEPVSVDDHAEALLNEMLQCEQITSFDDDEFSVDSQNSYSSCSAVELIADIGADLLIQDCMWNSHAYEPRNLFGNVNGMYTPAPSPPPPTAKTTEDDEPSSKDDTSAETTEETMEESSDVQSECISPCDIFPTCLLVAGPQGENLKPGANESEKPKVHRKTTSGSSSKRMSVVSSGTGRTHPQASSSSSESEEEIDVVTVTDRPQTRLNNRKRLLSLSAPCSRQSSPTPPSPKKRKYHPKRMQRISSTSTCSSLGDGTESDDEHRRASHNILERKRRNDLKYSFQVLRAQVPDLEDNQRAPKVTILRKAAEYIKRIQVEGDTMDQELERERKREAKLRQRLAFLKAMPTVC